MRLRAVFFDVGETIVDESRNFFAWADRLGVPRHTFSAVFGAVVARGGDHRETFGYFHPGFDLATAGTDDRDPFGPEDLYPDARPCLEALRAQGLRVGIAANQPARSEAVLRALALPVDTVATSAGWGVEKPADAFFVRLVAEAGCRPEELLYVGDRLDNDAKPAQRHGIATAFLRRGPWGYLRHDPHTLARCLFRLDSLAELPGLVAAYNAVRPAPGSGGQPDAGTTMPR